MKMRILAVSSILFTGAVMAETVVNFTPPAVIGNIVKPRKEDSSSAKEKLWKFNAAAPLFAGNIANGTKIFGGLQATGDNTDFMPVIGSTYGRIQLTAKASGRATLKGVLLWDSKDFLKSGTYAFGPKSSISANLFRNDGTVRWVIRNGDTYYISSISVRDAVPNAELKGSDKVQWAVWNPAADNGTGFLSVPADGFSAQTFNDVTAVGFAFDIVRGEQARFMIENGGFTVNLDAK